jgi:hypothetical protein
MRSQQEALLLVFKDGRNEEQKKQSKRNEKMNESSPTPAFSYVWFPCMPPPLQTAGRRRKLTEPCSTNRL